MIDDIVPDTITVTTIDKKLMDMLIGFTKEILLHSFSFDDNNLWEIHRFSAGENDGFGLEWAITYKGKSLLNNIVSFIRENYLLGIPTRRKIIQRYIIDFYQKNCLNDELFSGNAVIFDRQPNVTLLDCTRFMDVKYSGYLLMKALFQFLEQKNTNMLVLYSLGRIELENDIYTKGAITLIKSDYSLGWEEIRKKYPVINQFDPTNNTIGNKRWLLTDSTPVNTWLILRFVGDRENEYNSILKAIRTFLSFLIANVSLYSKNIILMNMPKVIDYCYIFNENNNIIKSPANGLLHIFPAEIKFTSDSIDKAFLGANYLKTLDSEKSNRFTLFCEYFMKSLNASNEEKLINLFIAIDALWGVRVKSEQTTREGMKSRMKGNPKNHEKSRLLYDLRCELVHGGCSLLDDWKNYDDYIEKFGTEPEEDLMQIVLNELNRYMVNINDQPQETT